MSKINKTPSTENKMGVMSEGKLLVNMATPMIVAMLVQALYNIVDSYYVSKISESAVTALGLAFPIQNLLIGFAVGIGVGVNSLLSRSLGQHDREKANFAAGNGMVLALIACGIFMLFGMLGTRAYFRWQSDVAETVDGGTIYTSICCIFSLGIFVEVLFERLLQASGKTFYTMITQGAGAIINIVLDPCFINGWGPFPKMGIAGAAVATVIGQWVAACLAIIFNLRSNHDVHFAARYFRPRKDAVGPILTVGIPSIIMNGIGSIMNFGMNQILLGFKATHGETPVSVFSIYFKLQSFFFMPVFGLNNAAISIVAFNYGARKPKRITRTLKLTCLAALCFMCLGVLVFQLLPEQLLGIFELEGHALEIGRKALGIISLCFPFAAIGIALSASFQALGNGIYSTITSLCRQLVVLLPVAFLLSMTGNVNNVWWAFPIAEAFSLVVTLLFFARIYRKKIRPLKGA